MPQPQLQELLEAGVHFGHQTRRWIPRCGGSSSPNAPASTSSISEDPASARGRPGAAAQRRVEGEGVLFVCTKKQPRNSGSGGEALQRVLRHERCWAHADELPDDQKQIKRLKDLGRAADGDFTNYHEEEQLLFGSRAVKLDKNLVGIKTSAGCRRAFVVDAKKERIAVARRTSRDSSGGDRRYERDPI